MAKVTIDIEDSFDGSVKVSMTPTFETMMLKLNSQGELSSGEGYAIAAINLIRKISKQQKPESKIIIPALT